MSNSRSTIIGMRAFNNFLFVPGNRLDRYAKALASGADFVCIDLEDSVPLEHKGDARALALAAISKDEQQRLALRINGLRCSDGLEDILAAKDSRMPAYFFIPMVESPAEIEILSSLLGPDALFVPLIETARGLDSASDIAAAPGVAALMFGGGDLAAQLGVELSWEPLLYARSKLLLACASAKIPAIDVPYIDLDNPAGLAEECAKAKSVGFTAKAAIHPAQIGPINDAMRPSIGEVEEARAAIAAFDAGGGAAIQFKGKMLEAPLINRYRQILSLGESIHA